MSTCTSGSLNGNSFEIKRTAHAGRGDQVARQDRNEIGTGDDAAGGEDLVDGQEDAPFAVDLRQRFIGQAMGTP